MRLAPLAVAMVVVLGAAVPSCTRSATLPPPGLRVADRTRDLAARVTEVPAVVLGTTYRPGCPVGPDRLRLVRMNHWGFDGKVHRGELVVHQRVVRPLLYVFGEAFRAGFPIRRMRPVSAYGGDDAKSMADDNTSAFNCRRVTGDHSRLSRHAYGDAVDINTVENPYVDRTGVVHPSAARPYLRRDRTAPGMIRTGDAVTQAFAEVGWRWGGRWSNPDYQHFSATGG
ncbi:M15 family metallopeptidase [Streptomyces sp. NPDC059650]|uniref:M15 family metallopeptidase n=1 Tax=Streptomyces sp. NPDC059650 TaxID=3346896 RepID=UPI0036919A04